MTDRKKFAPHGTLALAPQAFGLAFEVAEPAAPVVDDGGAAVVTVRGPLMHHRELFFDSYEAIADRVATAIELGARAVVLSIDSPGGLVSGAFDCSRGLRAMTDAAGVELRAHIGGQGTSAAYALASAAQWIGVSESAMVGSIGVIDTLVDVAAQNQALGVNVELVTSGARKADGNPNTAITDGARVATQKRVDELAAMFFELVAGHGWGGGVEALAALQAGIVTGAEAVDRGLASCVATLRDATSFAPPTAGGDQVRSEMKATDREDAVGSLRKMAESDDEEMRKMARAALRALGEDMPEAEDDEPKTQYETQDDDDDEKAAAAAMDDDEDDKAPEMSANAIALRALAEVHELKAARAAEKLEQERSALLASRPDFAPELVEVLRTAPLATVRKTVSTLKRGATRPERVAAAATATATVRGENQGDNTSANPKARRLPAAEAHALDVAMGVAEMTTRTVHTSNKMSFGVNVPSSTGEN